MPRTMTAKFASAATAEALYEALQKGSPRAWFIEPGTLRINETVVTWRTDDRADSEPEYLSDMRQTVGYYGSPGSGPCATLNGIACRGW